MSLNDNQRRVVEELDQLAEQRLTGSIMSVKPVLAAGGINLFEPLSSEEWLSFCARMDKRYNTTTPAGTGIHNVITGLFSECNRICGGIHCLDTEGNDHSLMSVDSCSGIKVFSKDARDTNIESVLIPVQISEVNCLRSATNDAQSHLATKFRILIDLYGFGQRLHGFCIGTDGLTLSIGHINIDNDELELRSTGMGRIPFWPNDINSADPATYPLAETLGVRIVRSLLSASVEQLGQLRTPPLHYTAGKWCFHPVTVLGRGAFCTAISAKAFSTTGTEETLFPAETVVLKKTNSMSRLLRPISDEKLCHQLQQECDILRHFTALVPSCPNLPQLFTGAQADWKVTHTVPFFPMQPVGQALHVRCASLASHGRLPEALVLHAHINAGLRAAHAQGYCHRDIRPANIVYDQINHCYVVIGWGLAEAPGVVMHDHCGGKPFCHDDIASAMIQLQLIPFQPVHDLGAARYVAFAFSHGPSFDTSTWGLRSFEFVEIRNLIVGSFLA